MLFHNQKLQFVQILCVIVKSSENEKNTHSPLILAHSEEVINWGLHNYYCCTVSAVEVPDMLENLPAMCLSSLHNLEVYKGVLHHFASTHSQSGDFRKQI